MKAQAGGNVAYFALWALAEAMARSAGGTADALQLRVFKGEQGTTLHVS
jgi:hypothetical protein